MIENFDSKCILTDDKTKCYTNDINELHTIRWKASVLPSTRYVCIYGNNISCILYIEQKNTSIFLVSEMSLREHVPLCDVIHMQM